MGARGFSFPALIGLPPATEQHTPTLPGQEHGEVTCGTPSAPTITVGGSLPSQHGSQAAGWGLTSFTVPKLHLLRERWSERERGAP